MLFVIGGELREVDCTGDITIDDEQWASIEKLSGLPPKARHELNDYIGYCKELRNDSTDEFGNRFWFDKLTALIKEENKSKKRLDNMINSGGFFEALQTGLDGQERIPTTELHLIRAWIINLSADKQNLLDWYNNARQRVHHWRTGERTGRTAHIVLVQLINGCLLRHTHKRISTAGNTLEFVTKVCVIAFPYLLEPNRQEKKLRIGAVNKIKFDRAVERVKNLVEEVVNEHLGKDESRKISDWQHLVPGWKPADHLNIEDKRVQLRFCKDGNAMAWHIKGPQAIELIVPDEPFVSEKVAAQQPLRRGKHKKSS